MIKSEWLMGLVGLNSDRRAGVSLWTPYYLNPTIHVAKSTKHELFMLQFKLSDIHLRIDEKCQHPTKNNKILYVHFYTVATHEDGWGGYG